MVFAMRTLLACIAHGILDRGDHLYQRGLATTSRRELWHTLRTAMRMIFVPRWAQRLRRYRDDAHPGP
jgi:hypothetical protein